MASKPAPAGLKRALKLLDTPSVDRIELALELAKLENANKGSVAELTKFRPPEERRMLYYLLDVGRWLAPIGQPISRYAAIGWTKLAILAEHSKKHPGKIAARAGLAYAEKCTVMQLPAVLGGAPLPQKGKKTHHSLNLSLTSKQYELFETALKKHGAIKVTKGKGLQNKEAALIALIRKAQAAGV
jgi:hypothetical protein